MMMNSKESEETLLKIQVAASAVVEREKNSALVHASLSVAIPLEYSKTDSTTQ
jgi:hypothetical protein